MFASIEDDRLIALKQYVKALAKVFETHFSKSSGLLNCAILPIY